MSNLYQDAILDAKALRASAIANAKAALEEAFEPKIQEMLRAKLSEEEVSEIAEAEELEEEAYEDGGETVEETVDITNEELDGILAELEELEQVEEAKHDKLDEAKEEEEEEEEEEEVEADEEIEGGEEEAGKAGAPDKDTKVVELTVGELISMINSARGEQPDAMADEMPGEEMPTPDSEAEAEVPLDEVSLDEILDELEAEGLDKTEQHPTHVIANPGEQLEEGFADIPAEAYDAILQGIQDLANTSEDGAKNLLTAFGTMAGGGALVSALRKLFPGVKDTMDKTPAVGSAPKGLTNFEGKNAELKEAKATIATLRKDLQEVNLLNAKYLYMNKLFKSKSLTESQKLKVVNALDRATSVKEVKNTYETLKESFETKKQTIKESIGFASKPAGMAPKANIVEADGFISRWQKLAGIKK